MRCAERIVFAFGALGEAGQAVALSQRADAIPTVGENLMRISLMSDVPDQSVGRRIEHIMQRHREFDHAEAGAEMASCDCDGIDRLPSQFIGHLPQLT